MSESLLKVFCWPTGLVQLAASVPDRALELASGPATLVAQTVDSISEVNTTDHNSSLYVVPGVKEAANSDEVMDAIRDYQTKLNKRLSMALASYGGSYVSSQASV